MTAVGIAGPGSDERTGSGSSSASTRKPARCSAANTSAIVRGQHADRLVVARHARRGRCRSTSAGPRCGRAAARPGAASSRPTASAIGMVDTRTRTARPAAARGAPGGTGGRGPRPRRATPAANARSIESARRNARSADVALVPLDADLGGVGELAGERELRLRDASTRDDVRALLRERDRVLARAAPEVEHPLAAARRRTGAGRPRSGGRVRTCTTSVRRPHRRHSRRAAMSIPRRFVLVHARTV